MIISHKYKFIFIAIPKTATHAIRFALRPHMDREDIEQVGLFVQKQSPFRSFSDRRHGHMTATEIQHVLPADIWQSYFKFAIVRNPYDRFISYCAFIHKNNSDFKRNPMPYFYNTLLNKRQHNHILFAPQSHFLFDEAGNNLVNYTGKYEGLQESFDHVCSKVGIPARQLDKINASERQNYKSYYNDELINLVTGIYKKDIKEFNYKF